MDTNIQSLGLSNNVSVHVNRTVTFEGQEVPVYFPVGVDRPVPPRTNTWASRIFALALLLVAIFSYTSSTPKTTGAISSGVIEYSSNV